jgi:hypothetical protein
VACPICPAIGCFLRHEDFYEHFMQYHFRGPVCGKYDHGRSSESWPQDCYGRKSDWRLVGCTMIPDEVKQHRRTILRVWPNFCRYPVWKDIQQCTSRSKLVLA